jgi:hypothetical protein
MESQRVAAFAPEPMRHPIAHQGMKAFEIEEGLQQRAAGRIALVHRQHVGGRLIGEARLGP